MPIDSDMCGTPTVKFNASSQRLFAGGWLANKRSSSWIGRWGRRVWGADSVAVAWFLTHSPGSSDARIRLTIRAKLSETWLRCYTIVLCIHSWCREQFVRYTPAPFLA